MDQENKHNTTCTKRLNSTKALRVRFRQQLAWGPKQDKSHAPTHLQNFTLDFLVYGAEAVSAEG